MARPKRGEILSLTIDDLAFGGEGVGRADGYVVFVPGALPGDRLQVRLVQVRSRFGRGVIESIDEASPQRVEAPCPYFGRCGGCRLQHVAYDAQLASGLAEYDAHRPLLEQFRQSASTGP